MAIDWLLVGAGILLAASFAFSARGTTGGDRQYKQLGALGALLLAASGVPANPLVGMVIAVGALIAFSLAVVVRRRRGSALA